MLPMCILASIFLQYIRRALFDQISKSMNTEMSSIYYLYSPFVYSIQMSEWMSVDSQSYSHSYPRRVESSVCLCAYVCVFVLWLGVSLIALLSGSPQEATAIGSSLSRQRTTFTHTPSLPRSLTHTHTHARCRLPLQL